MTLKSNMDRFIAMQPTREKPQEYNFKIQYG